MKIRTKWTVQEDYQLLTNILKFGKRWSMLSKMIKGRNEHSIKYHFYSLLKKHGVIVGEGDSDEVYTSKTMSEIFRILENMNTNSDDKTTNSNASSACEEENTFVTQNQWTFKENKSENKNLVMKHIEVLNCRLLNYWQRNEEDQMIFQEEMILNSKYEQEKIKNKVNIN